MTAGERTHDPLRPSDHFDAPAGTVTQPKLGPVGYLRFFWRQLTSMRTALILLLLLAVAAVPGSLFPQTSSDPNGVVQFKRDNPDAVPVMDFFQLFDVYTSVWFSAIYLLLFVSLVGCIIPRAKHHYDALRARPPRTPARLQRLPAYATADTTADAAVAIDEARKLLRSQRYRIEPFPSTGSGQAEGRDGASSLSAERGYLRETGNLVFHSALVGILVAVGAGGGFSYTGQKVIVQDRAFTNALTSYDSFNPGRFFDESALEPFSIRLDDFTAEYEENAETRQPQATDFEAKVTTTTQDGTEKQQTIKVNHPLEIGGNQVYLLGNGYAPVITVRDSTGAVAFSQPVPFLPQDGNNTSLGVIKAPDARPDDLAFLAFFYPTAAPLESGALTSVWPEPELPVLSMNLYTGDLGLDEGVPRNVYALDVDELEQRTGGETGIDPIVLEPGGSADLPDGLGSVTFEGIQRFVSLDIHHDPTQGWVLLFAVLVIAGLLTSLFVPRRRMWVKATPIDGGTRLEYAALARGDDPNLERAVADLATAHAQRLERRMHS
ncbi:cytochrome c biogenesis protein [Diaminobutyricimonas aerilata]|uniref:Cytochrome c biogenesis protein n=1 Tax=Diaminobutyricimonas aerilata TaxID=1162967 RepID=A0A2M9CGD6_9MICO|nr:cytochrome c biogenesis protein ResB [Diaminobutyricimonas aerilata]PJJ70912.1 cytochrome c biogenesis protein [Diaminobutyricimonas aerilata]